MSVSSDGIMIYFVADPIASYMCSCMKVANYEHKILII